MTTPLTSDKAKLAAARGLINEKRYREARNLLTTVNDPQAVDWIMKIDALMPPPDTRKPANNLARILWGALSLIAFVLAAWALLSVFAATSYENRALWGVFAFVALLTSYFARRFAR